MIPLPQNDEDEKEKQMISSSKEKENILIYKYFFKFLLFIAIMIILIISYNLKKKSSNLDKVIQKIPEKENIEEKNEDTKKDKEKDKDKDKEKGKEKIKEKEKTDKEIKKEEEKKTDEKKEEKKTDEKKEKEEKTDKVEETDNNVKALNLDLSIIINSFNKNNDLVSLIKNILSNKNVENSEIIITTTYNFDTNQIKNQESELRKRKMSVKVIEYNENSKSLKVKIESAQKAVGKYILFITPEEPLSFDIFNKYKNILKESGNIDIIQYDLDFDRVGNNQIVYQPQLYESLLFGGRDSFGFNHFHVNGKLYKNKVFIEATKNLDKIYLENSSYFFDEIMIIILVFQKAETFIKYRQNSSCNRNRCQRYQMGRYNYNKDNIKDIILFIRFLYECTGEGKVQEKRLAARTFNEIMISRGIRTFYDDENLKLISDTINIYLDSEIINDIDKSPIRNYKNNIRK